MIELVLTAVIYIFPFLIINYMIYSDLDKGDTLNDYNWAMFLLSLVPLGNIIICFIALFIYLGNSNLWYKIKNIKIK